MSGRALAGRGAYGASLLLGFLAAAELFLGLIPKLRPLSHLAELIHVYLERIHPALGTLAGNSWVVHGVLVALLLWLSSWLALEAFSRATDSISLWRSISDESCGMTPRGFRRFLCTATKWMFVAAAAPLLIALALVRRVRYGSRVVTVAFLSFAPGAVMNYMKHMFVGLGLLATVGLVSFGLSSSWIK